MKYLVTGTFANFFIDVGEGLLASVLCPQPLIKRTVKHLPKFTFSHIGISIQHLDSEIIINYDIT